jgi:hypothetical protein
VAEPLKNVHVIGAMPSRPNASISMKRTTVAAVGRNVLRKEGAAKVTGRARYIDDLPFPGLLHARTIRSTIAAGEILKVDFDFDRAGFTIVDHRDVPGRNIVALIDEDQPCLAERTVRHAAEPILLLVHEDRERLLPASVPPRSAGASCPRICWPASSPGPDVGGRAMDGDASSPSRCGL